MDGQGNLESFGKSGKSQEIENKWLYGRQSSENLFILFKRRKDVLSQR